MGRGREISNRQNKANNSAASNSNPCIGSKRSKLPLYPHDKSARYFPEGCFGVSENFNLNPKMSSVAKLNYSVADISVSVPTDCDNSLIGRDTIKCVDCGLV